MSGRLDEEGLRRHGAVGQSYTEWSKAIWGGLVLHCAGSGLGGVVERLYGDMLGFGVTTGQFVAINGGFKVM